MRIGIIGAGVAGLGAARTLTKAKHDVLVFEAANEVGGRCATETHGAFTFDTGATSIAPRGKSIEPVMLEELDTSELIRVGKPIYVHASLRVTPGEASHMKTERYTYLHGNERLPQMLAAGLDIRLDHTIAEIAKDNGKYKFAGENFDAVVLATPLPEAIPLLASAGEQRAIGHVFYRPCLSVLLGFDKEIPPVGYHAIVDPEQRHPLTWLSIESIKCPQRAPDGQTAMVAQLSPQYTQMHYDAPDDFIVDATIEYIERLYGMAWSTPTVHCIKRWRYSQPENLALFDSVNHPSARLVIASDGLLGGRIEFAFEAGARAAELLMRNA
jgi:hypothetical protein